MLRIIKLDNRADAEQVYRLWGQCVQWLGRPMTPKVLVESIATFIAVDEKGMVAGFQTYRHTKRQPLHTTLYDMAVHPLYRKQGVATSLILHVCKDSPSGVVRTKCMVNNPVCLLFRKLGFVEVAKEKTRTGTFVAVFEKRFKQETPPT